MLSHCSSTEEQQRTCFRILVCILIPSVGSSYSCSAYRWHGSTLQVYARFSAKMNTGPCEAKEPISSSSHTPNPEARNPNPETRGLA